MWIISDEESSVGMHLGPSIPCFCREKREAARNGRHVVVVTVNLTLSYLAHVLSLFSVATILFYFGFYFYLSLGTRGFKWHVP